MIKILTHAGQQIFDGSVIYTKNSGINVFNVISMYVISDTNIVINANSDNGKFVSSVSGDEVTLLSSGLLQGSVQGSLFIYPLHVAISYDESIEKLYDYVTKFSLSIDSQSISFEIRSRFEDIDERLIVLLQNEKTKITNDWYYAFRNTDIELKDDKDIVFINRKMKEFLYERFDLKHLKGSYKSLESIIKFFEYYDFVTIKEYWQSIKDVNSYKHSDILHEISQVDPFNDGFVKTRMIGLFYQINRHDGTFDEDGIPNYVLIDDVDFTQLYSKFNALERFLKIHDYLPDDIKLVDIVGEHTSFNGFDLREWPNVVNLFDIDEFTKFTFQGNIIVNEGNDKSFIRVHKMLIKNNVYSTSGNDLIVEPNVSAHVISDIMEIIKLDSELESLDDFDILTKYVRADAAIVNVEVTYEQQSYVDENISFYKISIDKQINDTEYQNVFLSDRYTVSTLLGNHGFAFRKTGTYKVTIMLYDYYGNVSTISSNVQIVIQTTDIQFNVSELSSDDNSSKRSLNFFTTYQTIENVGTDKELLVPDANDSNVPIFDVNDRTTVRRGFRSYLSSIDKKKLNYAMSNFNTVDMSSLDRVKLIDTFIWYSFHVVRIFEIPNSSVKLRMKLYDRHDWDEISMTNNSLSDIFGFVSELNQKPETSVFSRATYGVVKYSVDGTLSNTVNVLTIFFKDQCIGMKDMIFEFEIDGIIYNNANHVQIMQINELQPLMNLPAAIRIDELIPSTSDLIVKIDGVESIISSLTVNTLEDIYNEIHLLTDSFYNNGILYVNSKNSISLSHSSIPYLNDVERIAAAQKYVLKPIGNIFQPYSVIACIIDENVKYENSDIKWTIRETFSKEIVYTDNNYVLRWFNLDVGIFDVTLRVLNVLDNSVMEVTKVGAIKIE